MKYLLFAVGVVGLILFLRTLRPDTSSRPALPPRGAVRCLTCGLTALPDRCDCPNRADKARWGFE